MDTGNRVRILIAEDHPLLRQGLTTLLSLYADLDVCAQAGNACEAVEQFRQHNPDVVLTDLRLTPINGVTTIQAIRAEYPNACAVAMTTLPDKQLIAQSLADGAVACWLKTSPLTDLIAIIRALEVAKAKGAPGPAHTNLQRGLDHRI
jgi:DNA-binding NarL/FixJ family response regulator